MSAMMGTAESLRQAAGSDGQRVFGVFTWRPGVADVVTFGAASSRAREAVEYTRPIGVLIRYHDDWRSPLADLQHRIDASRARAQSARIYPERIGEE